MGTLNLPLAAGIKKSCQFKFLAVIGKEIYWASCSLKKKDAKLRNGVFLAATNSWDQHDIMTQTTIHMQQIKQHCHQYTLL